MARIFEDALLIADMDDTLLDEGKHFSESNALAIARFRELGGRFTVATGRSIPSLHKYKTVFTTDLPMILCNGALIYDAKQEKVLWEQTLPPHAADYVRMVLEKFPGVCVEILSGTQMYVLSITPKVHAYLTGEQVPFQMITPEEIPESGWYKILFALHEGVLEPFREFLKNDPFPDVEIVFSHLYFCEVLPKNVSKASGLRRWQELLGSQSPKRIYAVGDYYNDVQMLHMADVGFAVANAPEEVQRQADVVVSACTETPLEDALSYLLEKEEGK